MRFYLEQSVRKCYLGHVDTFEMLPCDAPSAAWLGSWDLYCRTCEALVIDEDLARKGSEPSERKDVIGYVVSVPVEMSIQEEKPISAPEKFGLGVEELQSLWDKATGGGGEHEG